jgi:hypothetical protein
VKPDVGQAEDAYSLLSDGVSGMSEPDQIQFLVKVALLALSLLPDREARAGVIAEAARNVAGPEAATQA